MRMPFPLPPLAEQERIGVEANAQLQHHDDARTSVESAVYRNSQQDNAILEAAALGGLVEPESEPRGGAGAPFARSDNPLLFANTANDEAPNPDFAELMSRALPAHWRWIRVDQAGELRLGRQRSPEHEYGEHLVPYLRVANVFEDRIDTSDVRSMNFTPTEQETYRLVTGDILLNEGQSPELVGRPALYTADLPGFYFQNTLIRFRAAGAVNPRFALLVFRHYLRSGQFTRAARWSTNIAHLGVSRLAAMPFPLPPQGEQDRIVAEADLRLKASQAQRTAILSSLDRLKAMRREIVRSAVSGTLMPQSPDDEPGSALLARLGPPPHPKLKAVQREKNKMARRPRSKDEPPKPLFDTILKLQGPISAERLFEAAGYNRDSTTDVEAFYIALRPELGVRIRESQTDEGIRLQGVDDAA